MHQFHNYLKLLRIKHYIKNVFIFLPAFFAGIISTEHLLPLIQAFFAFSLVASSVYIINDYKDISEDKLHPKKKGRPLAAGTIETRNALILSFILALSGLCLMLSISVSAFLITFGYLVLNIAYSLILKKIAIVDIFVIALGFVMRLFVGGAAADIEISNWIIVMTFLLSLFLAITKRRDDLILLAETGTTLRKSLNDYNLKFVDTIITILSSTILISYLLYVTSPEIIEKAGSEYVYLTFFYVIIGIFRYLQLSIVYEKARSPVEVLLSDTVIKITVLVWALTFFIILY